MKYTTLDCAFNSVAEDVALNAFVNTKASVSSKLVTRMYLTSSTSNWSFVTVDIKVAKVTVVLAGIVNIRLETLPIPVIDLVIVWSYCVPFNVICSFICTLNVALETVIAIFYYLYYYYIILILVIYINYLYLYYIYSC